MKFILFLVSVLSSIAYSYSSQALNEYEINKVMDKFSKAEAAKLGEAKFDAIGNPGLLTISGEKGNITGKYMRMDGKLSGSFDLLLNTLQTGMDLRDKHMREKYLETGKFPKTTLTVENVDLPKDGYFGFSGNLLLHGKTNKVNGDCLLKDAIKLECKFKILLSEYGIQTPEWMGVSIAKDVALTILIELK
jgi:polyisoprenoid-binding protein YceI